MKFSYSLLKKFVPKLPPPAKLAAGLSDHSFEIESVEGDLIDVKLPANIYSYAASYVGMAREAAAVFNLKLKDPIRRIVNVPTGKGLIKVQILAPDLCRRQTARYFEIKEVGASPAWMKNALAACDIRSINNIVDITNYVTLETGQPLHAFDADTLANEKANSKDKYPAKKILIRRAKRNEKITTLDGKKFVLDTDMVVIADREKSLDIAGIKGGEHTGIQPDTRRIILVASNFNSVNIYNTSRKLGLVTDASIRFSHNLSPVLVDWGLDRATELLREMGAKLVDSVDVYPRPAGDEVIGFDPAKYEQLIGAPVLVSDAKRYFTMLGFEADIKMKKGQSHLQVRVPAWRNDIQTFADLAEEVARLEGLNDLEKQAPVVAIRGAEEYPAFVLKDTVRGFFVKLGVSEVYNYSFVGPADVREEWLPLWRSDDSLIEVQNPIAEDKKFMRPALLPLLLQNAETNSRFLEIVKVFEVGKVFRERGGKFEERLALGIAFAARKNEKLVLELKGAVSEFLSAMGVDDATFSEEGGILRVVRDRSVLGELSAHDLSKDLVCAVAELDLDLIGSLKGEHARFKALPKYPGTSRDLSMAVPKSVKIGDIVKAAFSARNVEDVDLIDEYRDQKLGGQIGITLRIAFQAADRTLTDEEVDAEMNNITSRLQKEFGVTIR